MELKQAGSNPKEAENDASTRSAEIELVELQGEKAALVEELTECKAIIEQLRDEIQV